MDDFLGALRQMFGVAQGTPMMKAPKIACMPMYSVKAAARKQSASEIERSPPGQAVCLFTHGSARLIKPRPTVSMSAVNPSVSHNVLNQLTSRLRPNMVSTTDNTSQPTKSVIMADEITNMPIFDLNMLRSMRIRTITGSAVMAMDMPMKSACANCVRLSAATK